MKKKKKNTLKRFLIFQEVGLSSNKLLKVIFLGEPYRVFHQCFVRCFHFSPQIFTTVFRVFSLLIAFFHVTNFAAFLSGTSFLCFCTASGTDLWELFLLSGVFYLTLLRNIWHNLFLSTPPWEPAVLHGLPLRFETLTRFICLFESHIVQQNILVGRVYLSVKVLRNTISTSSRFWTHCLIAIYVVMPMSYLLGHRNLCIWFSKRPLRSVVVGLQVYSSSPSLMGQAFYRLV